MSKNMQVFILKLINIKLNLIRAHLSINPFKINPLQVIEIFLL